MNKKGKIFYEPKENKEESKSEEYRKSVKNQ